MTLVAIQGYVWGRYVDGKRVEVVEVTPDGTDLEFLELLENFRQKGSNG